MRRIDLAWVAWQAQFMKENAARASALRSKMRRRLRRTQDKMQDMTATLTRNLADNEEGKFFEGDGAYSV